VLWLWPCLVCHANSAACSADLPGSDDSAWRITSDPADGAMGVARQGRITVALGRLPLPRSVSRASVSLRSGSVGWWLDLRLQPARRELWITQRGALESETTYQLQLDGLVDLDGVTQPEPYRVLFATGRELGAVAPNPTVDAAEVLALLHARCARSECHAGESSAAGLDLASGSGIEATARNVAVQLYAATQAPAPRGSLYVAAPLIIDATAGHGEPARSYLVYKLLGDEHILGDRMPPARESPLGESEVQLVIDWIFAGAPTL
jgi:hypothetical protein